MTVFASWSPEPTLVHRRAPAASRYTPWPVKFSKAVLASPSPTHSDRSDGFTARLPTASRGSPSYQGTQWPPRSVDFHTPPSAAPAYRAPPIVSRAVMRPPTRNQPAPVLDQMGSA